MSTFKVVLSDPKTRKAYQKEVDQAASGFMGKKLGETIPAGGMGLEGYSIQLTGGSDKDGFPMRRDVDGTVRKKLVLSHPPGFHPDRKGQRKRKSIRGNTIAGDIAQVNAKVVEYGKKGIEELLGIKKEEKPADAKGDDKTETPKEEKKVEAAAEAPKKEAAKAEEKPAEPAKEEPKTEEKPAEPAEPPKEEPKKDEPPADAPKESKKEDKPAA